MIDVQRFQQHLVLRADHVVISVVRKLHPQAVGRLARLTMPDLIREDDEVFPDIQQLPRTKEDVGKHRVEERVCIPARAMNQEDRIGGVPCSVVPGLPESYVMKAQIRQRLARAETEIADVVNTVADRPMCRRVVRRRRNLCVGKRDRGGE